jgi:hypothetical protein
VGKHTVDQIDGTVTVDLVDVGRGGKAELLSECPQLGGRASEHHVMLDVRSGGIDRGVRNRETRSQQPDPHRGGRPLRMTRIYLAFAGHTSDLQRARNDRGPAPTTSRSDLLRSRIRVACERLANRTQTPGLDESRKSQSTTVASLWRCKFALA